MKPDEFLTTTNEILIEEHHAETCNPRPHPANPDCRGHRIGRKGLRPGFGYRSGHRRAADHWVGGAVSGRQARAIIGQISPNQ